MQPSGYAAITLHQDNTVTTVEAPFLPNLPINQKVTTVLSVLTKQIGLFAPGLYMFDGVHWQFVMPFADLMATQGPISVYFLTVATFNVGGNNVVYHEGNIVTVTSLTPSTSIWAVRPTAQSASAGLVTSAVPFVLAPTGSFAANGAVTLGTALPTIYAGGAWMYFPASAIASGSAAGWYWTVMTSTTVGTVYNNTYTSGLPTPPATPVAFVTTGPGAYSQVTTSVTALNVSVPANSLGVNGQLAYELAFSNNGTAGVKTVGATFGGTTFWSSTDTTNTFNVVKGGIANRNSAAANVSLIGNSGGGTGASTATQVYGTINTANAQTFAVTLQVAVATDYATLEAAKVTAAYA